MIYQESKIWRNQNSIARAVRSFFMDPEDSVLLNNYGQTYRNIYCNIIFGNRGSEIDISNSDAPEMYWK